MHVDTTQLRGYSTMRTAPVLSYGNLHGRWVGAEGDLVVCQPRGGTPKSDELRGGVRANLRYSLTDTHLYFAPRTSLVYSYE